MSFVKCLAGVQVLQMSMPIDFLLCTPCTTFNETTQHPNLLTSKVDHAQTATFSQNRTDLRSATIHWLNMIRKTEVTQGHLFGRHKTATALSFSLQTPFNVIRVLINPQALQQWLLQSTEIITFKLENPREILKLNFTQIFINRVHWKPKIDNHTSTFHSILDKSVAENYFLRVRKNKIKKSIRARHRDQRRIPNTFK